MGDLISRQAAIDAVSDLPTWYGDAGCLPFGDPQPPMEALMYPEDVVSAINNLPSADVEPVRHGRWIEENPLDAPNCRLIKCSKCGKSFIVPMNVPYEDWIDGRNFCYSCGARMDGEQNG